MNEVQKPNDILVATLSSPDATLLDLLQNNITASNTSFYSLDEYKEMPFIKKHFSDENGNLNELALNNAYLLAYNKYSELSELEAERNLSDYLEYSPSDRFRPIGGKVKDNSVSFKNLKNPLQQGYSITGINSIENPTITKEEAAQSNFIFDPETQKFTNKTPEGQSLLDKINGDTLIYAKWEDDGYHTDLSTGEMVWHNKGEWKTDKDGNYYTEYLGSRELGTNQVVNLLDILTRENSILNKIDVFDSDDMDKSAFGIIMKTALTVAPYFIPGVSPYYAALTTTFGLASVLPTFYKSMESLFLGEEKSDLTDYATRAENWFRKFEPSRTESGRTSFFSLEGIADLIASTCGQLYLQRAAASAAKWFLKEEPKLAEVGYEAYKKYWEESNRLSNAFNLGYMALISTSDIYNDAIVSGYDRRAAGAIALASAGCLFGIMKFNEGKNGLGTWFLDKTTGYNKELERGVIKKVAKEEMAYWEKGVLEFMKTGERKTLAEAASRFKRKAASSLLDIFVIGGEGIVKNAIVEGVEEVTEEMVQDAIKGIADTISWLGYNNSQGSFGGWNNVFSEEGLKRYLETFVGGALGGALFEVQNSYINPKIFGTPSGRITDYSIDKAIIDGRYDELVSELKNAKKFFNQRQAAGSIEVENLNIHPSAFPGKSQADIIYNVALDHINSRYALITGMLGDIQFDPASRMVYELLSKAYQDSGFDEKYIKSNWTDAVHSYTTSVTELQNLENLKKQAVSEGKNVTEIDKNISEAKKRVEENRQFLENWLNGENFTNYTLDALIYLNKELTWRDGGLGPFLNMDLRSYIQNVYGLEYDKLPTEGDDNIFTKKKAEDEWKNYQSEITAENFKLTLPRVRKLIQKLMPTVAKSINSFINNENNKLWLKEIKYNLDDDYNGILEYLENNPKYWSISHSILFDLASELEKEQVFDLNDFSSEELKVIKEWINTLARSSKINVWDSKNVNTLLKTINDKLEQNNEDNPFIRKLNEIREEQKEDAQVSVRKTTFDYDVSKVNSIIQNVKLNSILDIISEDDAFVDSELMHILETALMAENLEKKIKTVLNLLNFKEGGSPTLNDLIILNGLQLLYKTFSEILDPTTELPSIINADFTNVTINDIIQNTDLQAQLNEIANLNWNQFNDISLTEPLFDFYVGEDILNYISKLKEVLDIVSSSDVLSEDLLQKWEIIKRKNAVENPLYSMVKDIMHKIGNDDTTVLDYIFSAENTVRNGGEISLDKLVLKDTESAMQMVMALLGCMQQNGSALTNAGFGDSAVSFNEVMQTYLKLYSDTENVLALYPVFSRENLQYAKNALNELYNKMWFLENITKEKEASVYKKDNEARAYFNTYFAKHISEGKLKINGIDFSIVAPAVKYDADNPEQYILEGLTDFCERIKNSLDNNEFNLDDVITALIEAYPDAYNTGKSLYKYDKNGNSIGAITDNGISNSVIFEVLAQTLVISPKELNEKYALAIQGKEFLPRFDLELELKALIAKSKNLEMYRNITDALYNKYTTQHPNEPKNNGSGLTFVSGPAGSGKSVSIEMYLAAILPETVILTAPTLDKVQDLNKIPLPDTTKNSNTESLTIYQLFPKLNEIENKWEKIVLDKINSLELDLNQELEFDVELEKDCSVKAKIIVNDGVIVGVSITDTKNLVNLLNDISNKYKNQTIVIDESSNLSDITLAILNELHKESNTNFILLGDPSLIGYGYTSKNIFYKSGINNFYTHRTHLLSSILRCKNTAKTFNLGLILLPISQKYNDFIGGEEYVVSENGSGKEIQQWYKAKEHQLKYHLLMGDLIVFSQEQAKETLLRLSSNQDKKSFLIIYDGESNNEAKEFLKNAGFDDSIYNNDNLYKTLSLAQGAEADYVIVYNLKASTRPLSNGDVDSSRIYTALSRSKEFTLAIDLNDDGLFKTWGVSSINDNTVVETKVNSLIAKDNAQLRYNTLIQTLENIKLIPFSTNTIEIEEDNTESEDYFDEDSDNSDDDESDDDINESTVDINENENEENKLLDDGLQPNVDKSEKIKESLSSAGFDDAAEIYTYYARLGLTRDDASNLANITGKQNVDKFMEKLYNASTLTEQHSDLLAYWKFIANQSGISYDGQDLINMFIEYRNTLLYSNNLDFELGVSFKYRTDTDWAYFKPNDKTKKEGGGILVTSTALIKSNGNLILITLSRIGYNKKTNDNKKLYSESLSNLINDFISSTENWKTVKLSDFNENVQKRKKYFDGRGLNNGYENKGKNCCKFFTPVSGLRNFEIEGSLDSNQKIFNKDHLKFNRISLNDLIACGYEVEFLNQQELSLFKKKDTFLALYNLYRFEPLLDTQKFGALNSKVWIKIHPRGVKSNEFNTKLLLIEKVVTTNDGKQLATVLEACRGWKGLPNLLTDFDIVNRIYRYIAYLTNYTIPEGLDSKCRISKHLNLKNIKNIKREFSNLANYLRNNESKLSTTYDWKAVADQIELLKTAFDQNGNKPYIKGYTKANLKNNTPEIYKICTDESSRGFCFDYDDINSSGINNFNENIVVHKVYESYKGCLDFSEFYDKNGKLSYTTVDWSNGKITEAVIENNVIEFDLTTKSGFNEYMLDLKRKGNTLEDIYTELSERDNFENIKIHFLDYLASDGENLDASQWNEDPSRAIIYDLLNC